MKIVLIGYMGCGKSTIGKNLAALLDFTFKDLDHVIEAEEKMMISEIFSKKGEIYFRKKEILMLKTVLDAKNNLILATGGGTPCFGNTIKFLNSNKKITTVYLKSSIDVLTKRLFSEKEHRPLISHFETMKGVNDFVSKHLFERSYYYNQAKIKIDVDFLSLEEISESIKAKLLV